jgi:LytS/YehU family sensor histidine kinase
MTDNKEKHTQNTKILVSVIIGLVLAAILLANDAGLFTLGKDTSQYAILILFLARIIIASLILYLFTITGAFKRLISGDAKLMDLVWAAVLTLIISLYGNYGGVEVNGVLVNFRDVGAILAGLIGGPIVGTIVGIVSGFLRFLQGGIVAVPCMIGTILAGLLSGIAIRLWKGKLTVIRAIIIALIIELLHVIVIFPIYVLSMGLHFACR